MLSLSSVTVKLKRFSICISLAKQAMASKISSMCIRNTNAEIATSVKANAVVRLAIIIMHVELMGYVLLQLLIAESKQSPLVSTWPPS